jgi:UDP-N-acetylglucosamine acyltransferase
MRFSEERLKTLQKAFRYLLAAKMNTTQALEQIRGMEGEDTKLLAEFIEKSQRGVIK